MSMCAQKKLVTPKPVKFEKAKVLLIEDDRTMRGLVHAEIGEHCTLIDAESASHGVSMYNTHKPDLTFIDISLPDGDGFNVLEWSLNLNPNAFNVMFSGHTDNNHVLKSIEAGAKGYITKPFETDKMLFFVNQCSGGA